MTFEKRTLNSAPRDLLILALNHDGQFGDLVDGGHRLAGVVQFRGNVYATNQQVPTMWDTIAHFNESDIHPLLTGADRILFSDKLRDFDNGTKRN
jgi:hypothetical protein